ncbi:MAG: sulfite oxidase [Acidothermus sp.]|nr:sulfite oxidase [Acidothermus sp.]MCL6537111.1 sulfite oxidase [Acidothermus sp.]
MGLFVAVHQHAAETCPAQDPAMGSMLLQHLAPANAAGYGVTIRADAVANDKHTFYLIAEAASQDQLERFLAPFAQAGSVEILPASTCETVVSSGGCSKVPTSA